MGLALTTGHGVSMRDPKSTIYSPLFGLRWRAKLSRLSGQLVLVGIAFVIGFGAVLVLPYAHQLRDFLRLPRKVASIVTGIPRVLDGDKIEINGIHVRLNGIYAQEIAHGPGRPAERNGYAAKGTMQGIVGINASVRCELSGETTYARQTSMTTDRVGSSGSILFGKGRCELSEPSDAVLDCGPEGPKTAFRRLWWHEGDGSRGWLVKHSSSDSVPHQEQC